MRFMMLQDWPIGQFTISSGTTLNLDRDEAQMTQCERWAKDRIPPLNAILSLDWECAWVMHEAYGENFSHRLKRALGSFHEEFFGKLIRGDVKLLSRAQVQQAKAKGEQPFATN